MCAELSSVESFRFVAGCGTEVGRTLPFGGMGYPSWLKSIDDILAPVRSTLTQSGSILVWKGFRGLFGLRT